MADNPSIKRLCQEWRIALARRNLEIIEGKGDDANDAACDRAVDRTEELFEQIEATDPESSKDLFALLALARDIWKDSSAQRHDVDEKRALAMLQKAIVGFHAPDRKDRPAEASETDAPFRHAFFDLEGQLISLRHMASIAGELVIEEFGTKKPLAEREEEDANTVVRQDRAIFALNQVQIMASELFAKWHASYEEATAGRASGRD